MIPVRHMTPGERAMTIAVLEAFDGDCGRPLVYWGAANRAARSIIETLGENGVTLVNKEDFT